MLQSHPFLRVGTASVSEQVARAQAKASVLKSRICSRNLDTILSEGARNPELESRTSRMEIFCAI